MADKTLCFIVVVILSAFDFWVVKNLTGRLVISHNLMCLECLSDLDGGHTSNLTAQKNGSLSRLVETRKLTKLIALYSGS